MPHRIGPASVRGAWQQPPAERLAVSRDDGRAAGEWLRSFGSLATVYSSGSPSGMPLLECCRRRAKRGRHTRDALIDIRQRDAGPGGPLLSRRFHQLLGNSNAQLTSMHIVFGGLSEC
jgi:hypothetical protein